jgi:hypothetical protein
MLEKSITPAAESAEESFGGKSSLGRLLEKIVIGV